MINKIFHCIAFFTLSTTIIAQRNILIYPGEITPNQNRTAILAEVCLLKKIIISYSSSQFENSIVQVLPQVPLDLNLFFAEVFDDYVVTINKISEDKYTLSTKESSLSISGYISSTIGEVLPGATIINKTTGYVVSSDEKGFYFLESKPGKIDIEIRYVGHSSVQFHDVRKKSFIQNFSLENTSILPVFEKKEKQLTDPLTEILPINNTIAKNTVFGDKDPLNVLKTIPGVLPGGEGVSGLSIRGGSPDQNLILMEGMPIYEINHTGNLASIFMDESIRSIDFMKSGLPARYGGRLNAAINVQFKDGNNTRRASSLNAGLQGLTFFTQGPLSKDKFTYAITLRQSWINNIIEPIKKKFNLYKDLDIGYSDAQLKLCYKLKSTQKLSIAYYLGKDKLTLSKNLTVQQDTLNVSSTNSFSGRNHLISINYDHLLSNRLKLNVQTGILSYVVLSHGSYSYLSNPLDTSLNFLDVINKTKIIDKQLSFNMDYYLSENIKIKYGLGYISHNYNPAVKQSLSKINETQEIWGGKDSSVVANEFFGYFEGNIKFKKFIFVPGVYAVNYSADGVTLPSLQPRLQIYFKPLNSIQLNASYTNSSQYIHLLTNPGLGLPSELWVPSTKKIPAETVRYLSIGSKIDFSENLSFSLAYYYKKFDKVIDYSEPVDNILNVINPANITPIFNSQRDWERKIELGVGTSYGFESSINYCTEKFQSWLSYHYGRSFRTFSEIDNGRQFVSKFDKPHNISLGATYLMGSWQLGFAFVYTSGQPFTLADEIFIRPDLSQIGVKFIKPTGRNNYRMSDFHQLSINVGHHFSIHDIKAKLNFGVYNVYNRLNSFYIYSLNDADRARFFKVSIFPILPQLNIVFSW
jgi:hypothetical protein